MAKKWTDDEVEAEIKRAVQIVSEDRERATYASLHEKYGKSGSGDPSGSGDDPNGDGKDPKKGEGDPEPDLDAGKRRSLWWGEVSDE